MDYSHPPRKSGLPRDVLKWLQGLDLSISPRNVHRDFANGCIVAEIFSLYYPEDCSMHSFINGTSLTAKLGNWSQLERFLQKRRLQLTKEAVEGTMHCKPGAAEVLVQEVYGLLTNRRIIKSLRDAEFDFSDRQYQNQLPMVARSTASTAIKNNLSLGELMAEPDIRTNQRKVWDIIHKHLEHRATDRLHNPDRFRVKLTPGRQASKHVDFSTSNTSKLWRSVQSGDSVPFKEIEVRQPARRSLVYHSK